MKRRICVILGAGPVSETPDIPKDCFVIAADGGYSLLGGLGLEADLAVGDFDSLGYVPAAKEVVRHPVMKDDTDTMLAVREGLRRGFTEFLILGGLGGRLDHTLANLQTLAFLAGRGCSGLLFGDGGLCVTAFRDGVLRFPPAARGTISVFAYGGAASGVYLEGLKYPLTDATLTPDFPLGVSNEFTERPASVTVRSGMLLVLWKDREVRTFFDGLRDDG